MVITGEYVVKGLFHHCVVKGGLFHPVNLFFCPRPRTQRELSALGTLFFFNLFFWHNPPSLFCADVSERGYSLIIQMHGCTYIMDHQNHTHDPYEIQSLPNGIFLTLVKLSKFSFYLCLCYCCQLEVALRFWNILRQPFLLKFLAIKDLPWLHLFGTGGKEKAF